MELLILNILFFILAINTAFQWLRKLGRASNKATVIFSNKTYLFLGLVLIGAVPVLVFNLMRTPPKIELTENLNLFFSIILSLAISGMWFMYIRKLDIFETEKWRYMIATFVMGCVLTIIVPYEYRLVDSLGFSLNGAPWNDFMYSVFVIGGLEETAKIIPVLLILKFTKAIDEPYDYILYASVSALGFAFLENIFYIQRSELFNIGGRALYATVSHMVDTSIIGYGLLLLRYKYKKVNKILGFLFFFGLAMLAHGFYDFWLINNYVSQFSILTTLFFLGTIHLWFIFKNNAINLSNYFDENIKLDNDALLTYLLVSIVSLLLFGYILICLFHGVYEGNSYLVYAWMGYGYLVLYLGFSFSRFTIVRGYLNKLRIPVNFLLPKPIEKKEGNKS